MENGISIYLGLDNSLDENLHLLETAHRYGINRIFTSLHIPETNLEILKKDIQIVLKKAKKYNMEIISDVSPNVLTLLNIEKLNPNELYNWGISTIRLDFGYNSKEIAELSKSKLKIQFNASTITEEFLELLKRENTDFTHIDALHNFYPREGTGLSEAKLIAQNKLLHSYGIKVAAFVPSYNRARTPLRKGLPTLEIHRYKSVDFCIRHLIQMQIDSIFIGDSLPTVDELCQLSKINKVNIENEKCITIKAKCLTNNEEIKKLLSENVFTARIDTAENSIRTQESRFIFKNTDIPCEYIKKRVIGSITLDNNNAMRYKGEMQIILKEQPIDKCINIIGMINDDEFLLLKYINAGCKFRIIF